MNVVECSDWHPRSEIPPEGCIWASDGWGVWLINSDGKGIPPRQQRLNIGPGLVSLVRQIKEDSMMKSEQLLVGKLAEESTKTDDSDADQQEHTLRRGRFVAGDGPMSSRLKRSSFLKNKIRQKLDKIFDLS